MFRQQRVKHAPQFATQSASASPALSFRTEQFSPSGPIEDDVENIGRYKVVEELGKGAMGVVYKATDPNIGRTVALKTMRLDVHGLAHDEMLGRFRNEARAAGTLNHPNIVTIYDAGEHDGVFYIAMEFIEGRSLQDLLNERRAISVEQVLSITRQVCAGLDYAHQHGVIHRDVKPANIMITANGTAKIMDFGIAKAGGSMTSTGQVLGTPNYMAPEQIKGKTLDGRSDLFSLGVILYEMLTGEKPFVGENVTTIIYKIVNENPIPPRELDVSIHPGLSTVVTRALSKSPDERYQLGADLVRDLENYKSFGSELGATQSFSSRSFAAMSADQTSVAPAGIAAAPAPAVQSVTPPDAQVPPAQASGSQAVVTESGSMEKTPTGSVVVRVRTKSRLPLFLGVGAIVLAALTWYGIHMLRQPGPDSADEAAKQMDEARKALKEGLQLAQQATGIAKPSAALPDPNAIPGTSGELRITTDPPGATVQLDGQVMPGVTPLVIPQLKPGSHSLIFTREGYGASTRDVEITAGKSVPVSEKLKQSMGTLSIASSPADAEIRIDGKPYGKTPKQLSVPAGQHLITLRKEGYTEFSETATISSSQPYNAAPRLTPLGQAKGEANPFSKIGRLFGRREDKGTGTLTVTTRPTGAQVLINGSSAPGVTPVRTPINAGRYKMTIQLNGYRPIEREIVVEKGKVTGIDEILVAK